MIPRPARLLPWLVLPALCLAEPPAGAPAVSTVGTLLTDLRATPASMSDADLKDYQDKLTAKYAGRRVAVDGGVIIQVVTEGGGVKLIAFPPDESTNDFAVRRGLCYATLRPDEEAAGKKLSPGDSAKVDGAVASVSVKFDDEQADGKPVARVYLTLKDASVVTSTPNPNKKKKPTTTPAD